MLHGLEISVASRFTAAAYVLIVEETGEKKKTLQEGRKQSPLGLDVQGLGS